MVKETEKGVRRSVYIPARVNEALEREHIAHPWRSVNSLIIEAVVEKFLGPRPRYAEDDE